MRVRRLVNRLQLVNLRLFSIGLFGAGLLVVSAGVLFFLKGFHSTDLFLTVGLLSSVPFFMSAVCWVLSRFIKQVGS